MMCVQIDCTVITSMVLLLLIVQLKAEECPRANIQQCENCRAHSTCWPPISVLTGVESLDCQQACLDQKDCLLAEYTKRNVRYLTSIDEEPPTACRLYNCTDFILNSGFRVFRKSCTSDCSYFEVDEVRTWMVRCTSSPLFSQKFVRDEWQCLRMCLDYTGCVGAAFYKPDNECSLHDCHEMISMNSFWISYKRICKEVPSEAFSVSTKTGTLEKSTSNTLPKMTQHISSEVMVTTAILGSLLFTPKSSTAISGNESVASITSSTEMSLYTQNSEVSNKKCFLNNKASAPGLSTFIIQIINVIVYRRHLNSFLSLLWIY